MVFVNIFDDPKRLHGINSLFTRLAAEYFEDIVFVWTDGIFNPAKKMLVELEPNFKYALSPLTLGSRWGLSRILSRMSIPGSLPTRK